MNHEFITCLSRGANNADFRVVADEGGYAKAILDLYRRPRGTLAIYAQRDRLKVFVEVEVIRDLIARDGGVYYFDGFIGELRSFDGHGTGTFVRINHLSIDPRATQNGQTVGLLKMTQIAQLSEAI